MHNLIISVIPQFNIIPIVISNHSLPLFFGNNYKLHGNYKIKHNSTTKKLDINLQAEASIAPRSQIIKQFLEHVLPNSKNVFSICIIVFRRFSWNLKAEKKTGFIDYFACKLATAVDNT